jgi:hexosaminidase
MTNLNFLRFCSLFSFFFTVLVSNAQVNIIPKPLSVKLAKGTFTLTPNTNIQIPPNKPELMASAVFLKEQIQNSYGIRIGILKSDKRCSSCISLFLNDKVDSLGDEAYLLYIGKSGIEIKASHPAGILYGIQSLRQIFPEPKQIAEINCPFLNIYDKPTFNWRGLNLDCCRHFMDKKFILRYLDLLSFYKLNKFHWHLTEDQGWRIEIKRYPELTSKGAWRVEKDGSSYGGYYTQEDIKEIVAYANKLHIMVIPEIEMPGHSLAAIAAYPELSCTHEKVEVANNWGVFKDIYCAGDDYTFQFIEGVLTEVMDLFPAPYIHIGGDEAPKYRWEKCDKCKLRMKTEGLKDAHELQSYFIKRVEKFVNQKGKKIIGWDEILEGGLAPNATVQSWRGVQGAIDAVKNGNDAIVSPTSHLYFDYSLKSIDLKRVYSFQPIPEGLSSEESKHILGSECNMWTERTPQEIVDSRLFPRILAMSDNLWTPKNQQQYSEFWNRLQTHYPLLDKMGVKYGYEAQPVNFEVSYNQLEKGFEIKMVSGQKGLKMQYTLDGTNPYRNSPSYERPFIVRNSCEIKARVFNSSDSEPELFSRKLIFHEGVGKKVQMKYQPSQFYYGDGEVSIIDGQKGSIDFHDGLWLGLQEHDVEAIIDLGESKSVNEVSANFLRAMPSWILYPEFVEVLISEDGINFKQVSKVLNSETQKSDEIKEQLFTMKLNNIKTRYVKVIGKRVDVCPEWHEAAGSKAWIFIDEIIIK